MFICFGILSNLKRTLLLTVPRFEYLSTVRSYAGLWGFSVWCSMVLYYCEVRPNKLVYACSSYVQFTMDCTLTHVKFTSGVGLVKGCTRCFTPGPSEVWAAVKVWKSGIWGVKLGLSDLGKKVSRLPAEGGWGGRCAVGGATPLAWKGWRQGRGQVMQ